MNGSEMSGFMEAIKRLHGCDSLHIETVRILEQDAGGRTLWEGDVQVFELRDHFKASRCYAWLGSREGQFVVILQSERVDSPRKAVQSRIVLGSKRHD